jgi:hypothetical protein
MLWDIIDLAMYTYSEEGKASTKEFLSPAAEWHGVM